MCAFVDRCLSFCTLSFDHCVVFDIRILITPLISSNSSGCLGFVDDIWKYYLSAININVNSCAPLKSVCELVCSTKKCV